MVDKAKLDKIYQDFVGKDKIQALDVNPGKKPGTWVLRYKEGGRKVHRLVCENKKFLDQLLFEFNGQNPETCRANDRFLELGGWGYADLLELGHRVTKVKLSGERTTRESTIPISVPKSAGSRPIARAKRDLPKEVNLKFKDRESCKFTQTFDKAAEFDRLVAFIGRNKALRVLNWYIELLGTESKETGDQCIWKRLKAGDGSKRMVLELIAVNSIKYTDMVRQDLYNAAGDMFFAPCQRVAIKKDQELTEEICMFAAEDGKLDRKLKTIEV